MLSPFVSHIPPSPQPNTARRRSADEWNIPACTPPYGTDPPPTAPDRPGHRSTPHETPGRPRAPGRSRVCGPASAPLRCAGQRVRPRPCRAGPGSRLDATQRGAVRDGARCPDRNALGALRRAQAAAGRSSTRGRVGRRGGRTNDRPRGSAHVDGVKARRARAAAPAPPVRLPAGRDGAGAPPHGPDRARRPTGRQAPHEAGDVSGPAAGDVRPCRAAPRSRLYAALRDGSAPAAPSARPSPERRPTERLAAHENGNGSRSASWPPARGRHRSKGHNPPCGLTNPPPSRDSIPGHPRARAPALTAEHWQRTGKTLQDPSRHEGGPLCVPPNGESRPPEPIVRRPPP